MPTAEVAVMDPEKKALMEEVRATGLIKVVDAETYKLAGERWKALVALEKRIETMFAPSVAAATKALDEARALRAQFLDPVTAAKKAQPDEMKKWAREEERKRQEAERIANEAARKKAEDDAIAAAAALEKEGFKEAAAEIVSAPPPAPVVIQPSAVPTGFGGATQGRWKAQVMDIKALVQAVVAGKVPWAAIAADEKFLGQQARALKKEMNYPGVRVWEE